MSKRYGDDIALITVSFYSEPEVEALLDSLGRSRRQPSAVVVVNNAQDDSLSRVSDRQGVRVVRASTNLGYGGAVNLGARHLPRDIGWLCVANPDVVVGDDTLELLLAAGLADPAVGALGPTILGDDGSLYPSARSFPRLSTGIGHALLGERYPGNPWTRRYWGTADATERAQAIRDVDWLSGAFLLLRREAFEAVDGFDERYFMFFEDVDIAQRLADAGWRRQQVRAATVLHHGAHSTRRFAAAMSRAHHDSAYLYLAGRYRGILWAPVRLILRIALRARASIAARG